MSSKHPDELMNDNAHITALIVSQPGIMQRILVDSLVGHPVKVAGVASGALSAVEMLKENQPHLVLVDVNLPPEESHMLIRHIRTHYPQMWCVALAMTSRDRANLVAEGAQIAILNFDLVQKIPYVLARVMAEPGDAPASGEEVPPGRVLK